MNLKSIFNRGWLIGLLALLPFSAFANQILVVDLRSLVDTHHKKEAIVAEIQADFNEAAETINNLGQEVKDLEEKAQEAYRLAQSPVHSDSAKANYEQQLREVAGKFENKRREFQVRRDQLQQTFANREREAFAALFKEVSRVAAKKAEEKGAILLLDKSEISQGLPTVVFADSKLDITEEVRAILNESAPKKP